MRVYWSPLDNQVVLGRNHGAFCKGFIFCGSPLTVKVDAKIEGDETCMAVKLLMDRIVLFLNHYGF